jgi:hypothetical protein
MKTILSSKNTIGLKQDIIIHVSQIHFGGSAHRKTS